MHDFIQRAPNTQTRTLTQDEAFSHDELKWFAQFDRDRDLNRAVDVLFPENLR